MFFFFFNDTATTEIYTLSLHDALPIFDAGGARVARLLDVARGEVDAERTDRHVDEEDPLPAERLGERAADRSEEHTSELQSRQYLVCRLLLEKKKKKTSLSDQRNNEYV